MTGRRQSALLFLGVLIVYLASGDYRFLNPDPASALLPAWQLANHGDLYLDAFAGQKLWLVQAGVHTVSGRFPGATLFALPFYLLAPSRVPSAVPSVMTAAVVTAAAVIVLQRLLLRLVAPRIALGAALVAAFGTATWPISGNGLWTHGPGQLLVLVATTAAAQGAHGRAGLAYGAAVLVRPQLALVATVVGLRASWRTRSPRPAVCVGGGALTGLALLLGYNRLVFGHWSLLGGYASVDPTLGRGTGVVQTLRNLVGTLLSPARGLLWLCPFLALLLPGLPCAWRSAPEWVRGAAVGGTVYNAVQLWLIHYSGGYAFFGNRLTLEGLTATAPLLVLAHQSWVAHSVLRRRAFFALVSFSVVVHGLGALLYEARALDLHVLGTLQWLTLSRARPVPAAVIAVVLLLATGTAARLLRSSPVPVLATRPGLARLP